MKCVHNFVLIAAGLLALGACGDDDGDKVDAATGGNTAPVASFTMSPTCTSGADTEVTFTSTTTDADQDSVTCSWTFNSGTPSTSNDCTATGIKFPSVAPYDVTLEVDDGNGGTDSASMSISPC